MFHTRSRVRKPLHKANAIFTNKQINEIHTLSVTYISLNTVESVCKYTK